MCKNIHHFLLVLVWVSSPLYFVVGQSPNPEMIKSMISRFKADARGPYKDIRWFCKDGSIREARDPCPDEPGNQHARYKDEVISLAEKHHIFIGQILASTPNEDFWDAGNAQSRLKQYQIERYLRNIDDGWVNRQAQ